MSEQTRRKFMVLYLAPAQVLDDWAKTDPASRQEAEAAMRQAWDEWMRQHGSLLRVTEAAGRTKVASAAGIQDMRNDIMLYSIVEADSHESAVAAFATHPHLRIPQSTIQVMEVRSL